MHYAVCCVRNRQKLQVYDDSYLFYWQFKLYTKSVCFTIVSFEHFWAKDTIQLFGQLYNMVCNKAWTNMISSYCAELLPIILLPELAFFIFSVTVFTVVMNQLLLMPPNIQNFESKVSEGDWCKVRLFIPAEKITDLRKSRTKIAWSSYSE